MAKSFNNGVLILDDAGQGIAVDTSNGVSGTSVSWLRITSITVDPSAANWVAVLTHADGLPLWSMRGADARGDTYEVNLLARGISLGTATNLTRVVCDAHWEKQS